MKIEYDKAAGALYIQLQDRERGRTVEINDHVNLDLDEKGRVIGLEILNPEDYPLEQILQPEVVKYSEKDSERMVRLGDAIASKAP